MEDWRGSPVDRAFPMYTINLISIPSIPSSPHRAARSDS